MATRIFGVTSITELQNIASQASVLSIGDIAMVRDDVGNCLRFYKFADSTLSPNTDDDIATVVQPVGDSIHRWLNISTSYFTNDIFAIDKDLYVNGVNITENTVKDFYIRDGLVDYMIVNSDGLVTRKISLTEEVDAPFSVLSSKLVTSLNSQYIGKNDGSTDKFSYDTLMDIGATNMFSAIPLTSGIQNSSTFGDDAFDNQLVVRGWLRGQLNGGAIQHHNLSGFDDYDDHTQYYHMDNRRPIPVMTVGNIYTLGNVEVSGNLLVSGTTITNNSQEVNSVATIYRLNVSEDALYQPIPALMSGFSVYRGVTDINGTPPVRNNDYGILFDNDLSLFRIGEYVDIGSLNYYGTILNELLEPVNAPLNDIYIVTDSGDFVLGDVGEVFTFDDTATFMITAVNVGGNIISMKLIYNGHGIIFGEYVVPILGTKSVTIHIKEVAVNAGDYSGMQAVATRENSPLDMSISYWKQSSSMFVTDSDMYFDDSVKRFDSKYIRATTGYISTVKDNIVTRTDSGFYETATASVSNGWPVTTNSHYHLLTSTHTNNANYYSMQFAASFYDSNELYYRSTNSSGSAAWNKIAHTGNINTMISTSGISSYTLYAGTTSFVVPSIGTNLIARVYVQGAGGGGGGGAGSSAPNRDPCAGGGGGGAGSFVTGTFSVTAGTTMTILVGAGGGGGSPSPTNSYTAAGTGGAGMYSHIWYNAVHIHANGGSGGTGGHVWGDSQAVGIGGSIGGQNGQYVNNSSAYGGTGGSSAYGVGGAQTYTTVNATGYGAGGSGGSGRENGSPNYAGGSGSNGIIIIEIYDNNSLVTNTRYSNLVSFIDTFTSGVPANAR